MTSSRNRMNSLSTLGVWRWVTAMIPNPTPSRDRYPVGSGRPRGHARARCRPRSERSPRRGVAVAGADCRPGLVGLGGEETAIAVPVVAPRGGCMECGQLVGVIVRKGRSIGLPTAAPMSGPGCRCLDRGRRRYLGVRLTAEPSIERSAGGPRRWDATPKRVGPPG
jgi:hypothetical protein